ncbi:nucleotidyltransferase family protein [Pseudomonas aeruginosa]|uniref:nucleotidyltransferase family protein n=1 Tax=Pseudomonas aeruginosa TaxID=287 RepID=UPI001A2028F4|nr:nucleotidyltransferase domain-containing protein [Pseudomonas aeruginosa]HBO3622107.1 nucleotidyltransferase domain-containing protein [Pseudomonas aeruginosa]HCF5592607.1 nucleotidyltransferase domain-containing protein [Pseudomonas aeruginosa]
MSFDMYVFGSVVRGEVGATSDIDLLVIPADKSPDACLPASWSVYGRDVIRQYFQEGRLFAWHLFRQSVCVHAGNGDWMKSLGAPAPYTSEKEDVIALRALLEDSLRELRNGTESRVYELGICYTAIRDIAMAASWKITGEPDFSKCAPYNLSYKCPLPLVAYEVGMLCRHSSTRGTACPQGIDFVVEDFVNAPLLEWVNLLEGYL